MSTVRLGDHAKLIRGITFKPSDKCDPGDEGTVVCMRTKNVQATLGRIRPDCSFKPPPKES